MMARKKVGGPMSPFLKLPTDITIITLLPSCVSAIASAQAGRSGTSSFEIFSPHSLSCQTTPAFGPMISLNQLPNGRWGNLSSRLEAGIRCTEASACFSNDKVCDIPVIPENDAINNKMIFMSEPQSLVGEILNPDSGASLSPQILISRLRTQD